MLLVFENMKRFRSRFKYSLRFCQRMEESTKADALAKELSEKNYIVFVLFLFFCFFFFWKSLKKNNQKKSPFANCVYGVTGEEDITENWKQHYSNLLNSHQKKISLRTGSNITQTL